MYSLYFKDYNCDDGEFEQSFDTLEDAVACGEELIDAGEIEFYWVQDRYGNVVAEAQ